MSLFRKSVQSKLTCLIFIVILLANTFFLFINMMPVFASPELTLKWRRNLGSNAGTYIGPLAADINGDGKLEIVVTGGTVDDATYDGTGIVTALDGTTGNIVWQTTVVGVTVHTPFEIHDINNDGLLEIVVSGTYPTVLRGSDGSIIWQNTAVCSYNLYSPVADIDSDGFYEIFCSAGRAPWTGDDYFWVLSYDGKILRQNNESWHPCWGGLTIGDANFDGVFELYQGDRRYGYSTSTPYTYGEHGVSCLDPYTLTRIWEDNSITCSSHTPMLADVDKDGILDVIVTHQSTGSGGLAVYNALTGAVLTTGGKNRKILSGYTASHSQPTIADIDFDGNLEIIACRSTIPNPRIWDLYDWKADGELPVTCFEPPKVGDVTGDGKLDIIAVEFSTIYIYTYDTVSQTYVEVDRVAVPGGDGNAFTLVQDVDGDGYNELIVSGQVGNVYCYDTTALAPTPRVRSNVQFYSERHCGAAEYVPPPAPQAPVISEPSPENGATNVPITLSQLTFELTDFQHDPISYTVTTNPDVGSGSGSNVPNGMVTVPISGLVYSTTYTWTVTATDGINVNTKTFTFTTSDMPPWYNTDWQYRRAIVIDHTKVSGTQTNFPVVIDLTDASLTTKAQADGDDFLFTDENNVKLSHEIELYDSSTGHLIVWIKVPQLSTTVDTKLYMYYGNTQCGNQQDPAAVWDTNNVLVLHLDESHECRMWGMISNALPHDVVLNHLISAPNSLKNLGLTNDDGWGLVYYLNQAPTVTRGQPPAYADPNFDVAANAMADSGAQIGIGHVRLASSGSTNIPDPHPFMRYKGGKSWAFAHHGGVPINIMKNLIGADYLAANPPTYGSSWDAPDIIDSDLYALWVLKCIEANNWDVQLGIAQAIKEMEDAGANGNWNFLLSDGVTLWAFRKGDSTHTLWYYQNASLQYSAIASEKPNPSEAGWVELANYNLAILTKDSVTLIADIRTKYPTPILVDSEFSVSASSDELRANSAGQDWYESRAAFSGGDASLLTLDTADIGGNTGKKAALKNYGISSNAYLTQNFTAQTGTFTVSFDIYIDRIQDNANYDRTGLIYIGDDSQSTNCPTGTSNERFVFMAFYDPTPGDFGDDLQIRARTSSSQAYETTSSWLQVASGLSYDTWYTIRLVINVAAGTYDVYVNDVLVKAGVSKYLGYTSTSVSYISFSADSDGRGDFYVDNVYAPSRNRYRLTVNKVGNGSVNRSLGESSYLPATAVTLTAVPASNWMFSGWSGDLSGTANPATITVDSSKTVTATFTSLGYTLTVNTVGSGSIIKDPDLPTYPEGTLVTLTAVASSGWSFSGWSGDLSGSTNPTTITMTSDKTVTATFTQDQYTLTVNVSPAGSGTVAKNPNKSTYTYGESVTLTATPAAGWVFSHWSGGISGSNNPVTIQITGNTVITAEFIQGYSLTINVVGEGSVSKVPDQAGYIGGATVTLTASPAIGWSFSGWSGDLTGNDNPATIIMDSDKVITATFTQNQYTLAINIVGGGSVSKNPNKATYTYNEIVTLTATADSGWKFQGWSGDLTGSENPATIVIDGNKAVIATFIRVYTLAIGIIGSGSVVKNPDQATYEEGTVVTLTATPAIGWSFSGWSGDLSGSANPATILMTSDKAVIATFTPTQYTLTVNIVGSGSVTKNPNKATYNYGETVTLTAVPATGWSFFRWSGDLTGSQNPATIFIDGSKVVTANFIEGTVCFDSSPYGNNGAIYGGVTQGAAGKIDGAVRFDGSTGYIQIPHSDTLSGFTQGLTISFWIRLEDTSRRQTILNKYNTATGQRSWFIEYNPVDRPTRPFGFYASYDGTNYREWYASFVPSANTWYYITVVWEANTVPKFYVNGALVTTVGTSTISLIYNNVGVPLYIARCPYNNARYLKGSLDEIRISNIARSASYILTSYNNQLSPAAFYTIGSEESLPSAPFVFDPDPESGATNVPLTLSQLSFTLQDYQNDLMNYEVTTVPNIGGGSATGVTNGRYSVPVSNLQPSTTYTWHVHVTDGTHETDVTYTFTTMPRFLADPEFTGSADDADLRANTAGVQDWYESRGAFPTGADPTLLTLDTSNVGGNTGKKAALKNNVGVATNAYLTQEFSSAMTSTFDISFDIYIDRIEDSGSYDRTGNIYIGDDRITTNCPTGTSDERFVCLAFYDPTPGDTGNDIILKARTLSSQSFSTTSQWLTVAEGLSYDTWITIKLVINPAAGTYDVYVNGVNKGTFSKYSGYTPTSISYISFVADSEARGAFYVDNVFSPAVDRYRLTVNTVGSGSVIRSPAESTYMPGSLVTLTANPAPGWYFDSWSGDASGNANPTTITMDGNKVVTAIFTQDYKLTINIVGSGSVSKDPDQTSYTPGAVVTLTATPAPGWAFSGWSGDLTGNNNPATIIMDSSKVVTATFTPLEYTLTVNVVGNGVVARNPDQATYEEGTVVTLTAIPLLGWSFSGWSGDLSGSANPTTIIMDSDKTVTATFTQDQYTLTINVEGGGSVTKTPNQPTYTYGTVVQLTANPEPGYAFSYWTGDLSGSTNPASITMTGNKVVTAVFEWAQANWWNSAWKYRRTITIDHTKVSGDQIDFPVLIDLTDASLTSKARTDGYDFVFVDSNQVKLSHEIEFYDSSTGHLIAWVKIPLLSSTSDTILYLYYGNPSSGNQQDVNAVWDTSYRLVLHLDETSGTHYDSTAYGNNGTPYNGVIQGTSGKIDGADVFDGNNDYVQVAHSASLAGYTEAFTVSFWVRIDDTARRQTILGKYNTATNQRSWFVDYNPTGRPTRPIGFYASYDGTNYREWYASFVPSAGVWYHITIVWEANAVPRFYVNGALVATVGTATIAQIYNNVGVPLLIGRCQYDGTRYFKGALDEIRISNPARSASYILTSYNNQQNPATFYAIGGEEERVPPRYTLTINIVGQGTVTKDPDQITYPEGTVVQLTATADLGWTFQGWSGDLTGTDNPAEIIMDGNKVVYATFTQDQYTLTVNIVGSGSVTKTPNQVTYTYGTVVTLEAMADPGWNFTGWSGDLTGTTNPTTIIMTGNKEVTATFMQLEYTLSITLNPPEGGSVTVNPTGPYHYGDTVQLEAIPITGWYFSGWSGDLTGSESPATLIIDGNKAVTATFIKIGYTLTINVVGNGSVTVSPLQPTYDPGTEVTLTAVPALGWSFSGWSGDLSGTTSPAIVIMDSNKIITATFTEDQYTLDITIIGNGQVAKNPDQATYTYGTIVTLTATANLGWTFEGWGGDLSGSQNPTTIIMDGNKAVTATFTPEHYTLTVNIVGSGSVNKSPDQATYTYGTEVTLTAVPEAGWLFSQWSGDVTGSTNPTTITITGNKAVTATFIRLLADSEFSDSVDDADLRANTAGVQDWYESRGAFPTGADPTLLTLDTSNVGGNTGKKAALKNNVGVATNAYLTQEFPSAITSTFTISFDIYIDWIEDSGSYDRTGNIYIGDDRITTNCPTGTGDERFVCLAFYDPTPGTTGNDIILKARTLSSQSFSTTSQWLTVAEGLSYDTWITVEIVINPSAGTYEVYVNGASKGTFNKYNGYTPTSVSYISFVADSDARGGFYVDNVHSPAVDRYRLTVNTVGSGSVTVAPGESTYMPGSLVTLTANPAPGWYFDYWSGDFTGNDNPATIVMDGNKVITATFSQIQYTLTVNIVGSGSVTKSPDKTSYNEGESVTLTAVPALGWSFSGWSGDLGGSNSPATIIMDGNKEVTATFSQDQYTLTIEVVGSGSVGKNPDKDTYVYGESVTLTATAETGWYFAGWSGDASGTDNPLTIIMDGSKSITATFIQNQYTLTINVDGEGFVSKNPDQATYTYGQSVELTANAGSGWAFDHWSGALTGSDNPATLIITGDATVTAHFTQNQYTLSITIDGSGSVSKNPDQPTYTYGTVVELTATAEAGWAFSHWSGDASGSTNPTTITIDGDKTVTAVFTQSQYTLTINIIGSGTVAKTPDYAVYTHGETVTLTATPEAGWSFDGWSGDLTGEDNPAIIIMDGDKVINATFTQDLYTLTINVEGEGSVTVFPEQTYYTYGTLIQLTANPNVGWAFDHWGGALLGSDNPINFEITGDMTVIANFTQIQYTITLLIDGSGSVAKSPDKATYVYGESVELTANPDVGWSFSGWGGDLTGSNNPETIVIDGDKTVTATFIQDQYILTITIVGSGTVSKNPDQGTYTYGTNVLLTAVPEIGWSFQGWSGDLTGSDNPATITITGNTEITATFTPEQYTLTLNIVGQGSVAKDPDQPTYTYGTLVQLTATPNSGWIFAGWSDDLSGNVNPATITIDGSKSVTATFIQNLLADSNFDESADDGALRADTPGVQDWYESRNDDPTLLTLDKNNIGGNTGNKVALKNYGITKNAYLTQEFSSAQTGIFTVQFDIYIDRIQDNGAYDRTGLVYIGDNSIVQTPTDTPCGTSNERFVFMTFYDSTPGDTGNDIQIRVRTSSSQAYGTTSSWTLVASGLSYDTWITIKIEVNVPSGTFKVYVDGVLKGTFNKYNGFTSSSVTHISFSADSDGRGDFYVDNVYAVAGEYLGEFTNSRLEENISNLGNQQKVSATHLTPLVWWAPMLIIINLRKNKRQHN